MKREQEDAQEEEMRLFKARRQEAVLSHLCAEYKEGKVSSSLEGRRDANTKPSLHVAVPDGRMQERATPGANAREEHTMRIDARPPLHARPLPVQKKMIILQ